LRFYCASKFALEAYAEVLHYELTGLGIDSVLVEPGPFPTCLLANSPGPLDVGRAQAYGPLSSIREMFVGNLNNSLHLTKRRTRKKSQLPLLGSSVSRQANAH
jgi:NAD(P)-dependent dehydrogenase (short-subunit alcohol dehydrogenase family)